MTITNEDAVKWMENLKSDIGQMQFRALWDYEQAMDEIIKLLSAEPSEQYKKGFEDAKRAFELEYARESENMRKRNAELEVLLNAQKATSAEAEWITDSKPMEDGRYLVTLECIVCDRFIDLMHYGKPLMPNREVKGMCWYDSDDEWGDIIYADTEILAWMPLPKPYKESEVEG